MLEYSHIRRNNMCHQEIFRLAVTKMEKENADKKKVQKTENTQKKDTALEK